MILKTFAKIYWSKPRSSSVCSSLPITSWWLNSPTHLKNMRARQIGLEIFPKFWGVKIKHAELPPTRLWFCIWDPPGTVYWRKIPTKCLSSLPSVQASNDSFIANHNELLVEPTRLKYIYIIKLLLLLLSSKWESTLSGGKNEKSLQPPPSQGRPIIPVIGVSTFTFGTQVTCTRWRMRWPSRWMSYEKKAGWMGFVLRCAR